MSRHDAELNHPSPDPCGDHNSRSRDDREGRRDGPASKNARRKFSKNGATGGKPLRVPAPPLDRSLIDHSDTDLHPFKSGSSVTGTRGNTSNSRHLRRETPDQTAAASQLRPGPICPVCPIRSTCRSICELVEAILPSPERGRVDAEDLPRLFAGIRMRRALLDYLHLLTPHQAEVVRLYYRESLQQKEIAERLGVSQQAVHDSLRRARKTIGEKILQPDQLPALGTSETQLDA